MKQNRKPVKPQAALLGLGLDAQDGHKRITRGEDFLLAGGSQETHQAMQETVIKVTERLSHNGRRVRDASPEEIRDLLHEVQE